MENPSIISSQPIIIDQSSESKVYGLFALAMAITVGGVYIGMNFAPQIMTSGAYIVFLGLELVLIVTARWWVDKTPLNYVLFALFPLFSGFSITPFIMSVLVGYANGAAILLNALSATAFMAAAAAVFARTTSWNLGVMSRALFFALIGLIGIGILQIFVPALRATQFDIVISGAGIVVFALFTAMDMQRISKMGQMGASPFLMALSLYLDIFNLFLYILRFMIIIGGQRR